MLSKSCSRRRGKKRAAEVRSPVSPLRPGIVAIVLSILATDTHAQTQGPPELLSEVGIDQKVGQTIPLDLRFTDPEGKSVRLGDYFGARPVILSLVYYECPMLCSMVLNGVLRALNAMTLEAGSDFQMLTVSIDPRETSTLAKAKKANYHQKYRNLQAPSGWEFLVGNSDNISRLAHAVGFRFAYDEETDQFAHASGIMILTPTGQISRYAMGVEYSARDIRLSLVEAGAERIGNVIDQLLLYCFHYDPSQGRYSLAVINVLRLAGSATAIGLIAVIMAWIRRDRARQDHTKPPFSETTTRENHV